MISKVRAYLFSFKRWGQVKGKNSEIDIIEKGYSCKHKTKQVYKEMLDCLLKKKMPLSWNAWNEMKRWIFFLTFLVYLLLFLFVCVCVWGGSSFFFLIFIILLLLLLASFNHFILILSRFVRKFRRLKPTRNLLSAFSGRDISIIGKIELKKILFWNMLETQYFRL